MFVPLLLLGAAFVAALLLHLVWGRWWLSLLAPQLGLAAYVFHQSAQPHEGGGASMWLVVLVFAAPLTLMASGVGLASAIGLRHVSSRPSTAPSPLSASPAAAPQDRPRPPRA